MIPMDAKKTPRPRFSKERIRALAWAGGALAFALPWAAFRFVPSVLGGQQVVTVPAGSRVVVTKSANGATGVQIIRAKGVPVATTRASAPPPKI